MPAKIAFNNTYCLVSKHSANSKIIILEEDLMSTDLVSALADLKENKALDIARQRLEAGDDPIGILDDARKAMGIVGKRFEESTYFIPDLVYSGEILRQINEMVKPNISHLAKEEGLGKFLMGTVAGDIHDIGKNLVSFLLDVSGFDVLDLGIDVPPPKFVEAIRDYKPDIVGLSGFLTTAFDSMKDTVETIEAAGLRDKVRIMIGGGVLDEKVVAHVKADGFERNAAGAVRLSKEWLGII